MKKVYAVNSGSYSDYQVDAIFSTREKAQEFMTAVPDSDYNAIEEYELDPGTADLIARGYSIFVVHMLRDGTTERVFHHDLDTYGVGNIGHSIWRRSTVPAYEGKNIPDVLVSLVWAKTEQEAVKIANEHRAQMIATGKWK